VADDEREECLVHTPPCRRIGGHWIHADAVVRTFPRACLKLVRRTQLRGVYARYFNFVGVVIEQRDADVTVLIYGPDENQLEWAALAPKARPTYHALPLP